LSVTTCRAIKLASSRASSAGAASNDQRDTHGPVML
jgi:hypothetical protein